MGGNIYLLNPMDTLITTSTPVEAQIKKPVVVLNDISHRAHNLARIIDRLSSGTYEITIVKDGIHAAEWKIEIVRIELIQRVSLSNKSYVAE